MRTIIVNGKKLENLVIEGSFELPYFNVSTETTSVDGRVGSIPLRREQEEFRFPLPLVYVNGRAKKSNAEIMKLVTDFIYYDEPVEIQVEGEDWCWYGYLDGPINLKPFFKAYQEFEVEVVLNDPTRYSVDTFKNTAYADNVSVVNNGTHSTPFVLEATALKDSPYFMVTDVENNHFMIGEDSEDVTVKNYSPKLLTNEFRDKLGFSRAGETESIPDRYLGGTLGAAFEQTPETWKLNLDTVKQTSGWRGGALGYSFNRTAQNFRTTFKVNIDQRKAGSGKIGQFIYDENNRLMFSVGYQNVHASKDSGRILFMAYNEAGEEKMLWGPVVPHKLKRAKILTIYFRLERIGERIRLSYWTYDDLNGEGRHEHTLLQPVKNRTFNDSGQFYQRKVASTKFGIFRGNGTHRNIRALGVYMYELLDKPKNAKDYIIKEGDMITLDTKTHDISVNGEPMLREKSLSSNFFELQSGLTNLLISPEGNFDTVVKWRDRYK